MKKLGMVWKERNQYIFDFSELVLDFVPLWSQREVPIPSRSVYVNVFLDVCLYFRVSTDV